MASAVLANRNEHYFGEQKIYRSKYPENPPNNTRFNFRPNPSPYPPTVHDPRYNQNVRGSQESVSEIHPRQDIDLPERPHRPPSAVALDSALFYRKPDGSFLPKDPFSREHVTYNISLYSCSELKELKKRLISDLERVRSLMSHIQTGKIDSRPSSHFSQFRPPPVDVNHNPLEPPPKKPLTLLGNSSAIMAKKKAKMSSKKRASPYGLGGPKRPVMVQSEGERVMAAMMRKCRQILTALMKHTYGWVFNKPVDVKGLGLHDYFQIIDRPMDLGTVKAKLIKKIYRLPLDFAADVRLTFENAMKYNLKGQDVHTIAEIMLSTFEGMFQPEYQKFEADYEKATMDDLIVIPHHPGEQMLPLQAPAMTTSSVILVPSSSLEKDTVMLESVNLLKQKAEDSIKRALSFEEKLNLGSNLQNLPMEKMGQLLQIVGKRNPHLLQGDELELDIESLDDETIWELHKFVTSLLKAEENRRADQSNSSDQFRKQAHKSPRNEVHQEEASLQKSKKGDAGEEDVDIGEEIPANNFPPVEIEKDPACATSGSSDPDSSSCSSDDSSSSDSESGSSSASASDEDSVQSPYIEPKKVPTD